MKVYFILMTVGCNYRDGAEEDPPLMPEPPGEPVLTYTFVESDHALNVVTSRSHIGILLFV